VAVCLVGAIGASTARAAPAAHRCLVATGGDDQAFSRNFNPFEQALDFTNGGIYEPLVVTTAAGGGHQYNWLASKFAWSRDGRTLTLTVRHGVRWSDGRPLTPADVVFTLTAGRRDSVLDQIGLTRPGNEVVSVRAVGSDRVAIRLRRPDFQFVQAVLANNVHVVPKHIWAHVKHVGGWANPNPVGTGPFDVVERFDTQSYILARNPHYWQRGRPFVACLERVVASSPESALFQLRRSQVDVTNDLFPNVQAAYVAHDPAHFHFFYATNSGPGVGLFLDDTVYPFSLVDLRKAISLAIDRPKLTLSEYRYAPTVDALGINHIWPQWVPPGLTAEAKRLATYDPDAARRLLTAAGFTYKDSTLLDPRGAPVKIDATVIGPWLDWHADWSLIAGDLGRIGIAVTIDAVSNFGDWINDAIATKKATLLWNSAIDAESPYSYFEEHLDPASFVPSGKDAGRTGDWEHFADPAAAPLLAAFRAARDRATQRRVAAQLERTFLDDLPFVPLFASPTWSTYSTRFFTGYPTPTDDYVQPDFTQIQYVVALTRIRPRN
jgi:peptide/nickel transport system substrate-binding protein